MFKALFALIVIPLAAVAGPLDPGDINPGSTLLNFDGFANGTYLSTEFPGVTLSSGSEPGGTGTSAFVAIEVSTNVSPPNKIIGTINLGGPSKCPACDIIVTFDDPLPTQVGFWVSDADQGQFAVFSGPSGPLGTVTVNTSVSADAFFMGWEDANGISRVIINSVQQYGVGIDDLQFGTPVEPAGPPPDQWCSVDTESHTGLIGFVDAKGTQTLISLEMTPIQTNPPQGFGPTYTLWTINSTGTVQLSGGFYSAKYSPKTGPRTIYKIGRVVCSTPLGDGGLTDFSCVLNRITTPCSID